MNPRTWLICVWVLDGRIGLIVDVLVLLSFDVLVIGGFQAEFIYVNLDDAAFFVSWTSFTGLRVDSGGVCELIAEICWVVEPLCYVQARV